jgi:hypothetical protein
MFSSFPRPGLGVRCAHRTRSKHIGAAHLPGPAGQFIQTNLREVYDVCSLRQGHRVEDREVVQSLMLQFDKDCPGYNPKEGSKVCYKAVVRACAHAIRTRVNPDTAYNLRRTQQMGQASIRAKPRRQRACSTALHKRTRKRLGHGAECNGQCTLIAGR